MSNTLSSTASTQSATTTNPRTPRPSEFAIGNGNQSINPGVEVATLSSSDLSSGRRGDILPTWPNRVDKTKIRALACWHPDRNMNISMDIHTAQQHRSALFTLHTSLRLKGVPGTPRNGFTNAFIFIYPERIHQLAFDAEPQRKPFGGSTIALTFKLDKASALVLPKSYTGFGSGAERVIRSLYSFIRQSSFTIYASLPPRRFPRNWWDQLCNNIAERKVATITTLADVQNLYQRQGGQLIEGDGLFETVFDRNDATTPSPPAYPETDPSASPARPTEMKRSTNETSIIGQTGQSTDTVTGIMAAMLAAHKRELEDMVNEKLMAHKRELEDMVNERLMTHKRELEALLADKNDDLSSRITEEIDNGMEQLQEQVMEDVLEHVMEQLASMPVQTYFTFPNHPYL